MAPKKVFGKFGNWLLAGMEGNGRIAKFDAATGKYLRPARREWQAHRGAGTPGHLLRRRRQDGHQKRRPEDHAYFAAGGSGYASGVWGASSRSRVPPRRAAYNQSAGTAERPPVCLFVRESRRCNKLNATPSVAERATIIGRVRAVWNSGIIFSNFRVFPTADCGKIGKSRPVGSWAWYGRSKVLREWPYLTGTTRGIPHACANACACSEAWPAGGESGPAGTSPGAGPRVSASCAACLWRSLRWISDPSRPTAYGLRSGPATPGRAGWKTATRGWHAPRNRRAGNRRLTRFERIPPRG